MSVNFRQMAYYKRHRRALRGGAAPDTSIWGGINWSYLWTSDDATATTWPGRIGGVDMSRSGSAAQLVNGSTTGLTESALRPGQVGHGAVPVADGSSVGGWKTDTKITLPSNSITFRCLIDMTAVNNGRIFFYENFFGSGLDYYFMWRYSSSGGFTQVWNEQGSTIDDHVVGGLFATEGWVLIDIYTTPGTVTSRWNGDSLQTDTGADIASLLTNGDTGHVYIGAGANGQSPIPNNTILGLGIFNGDLGLSQHQSDAEALGLYTP